MRAYLQLVRLPNVFTAMADIFLGFLLTHRRLEPLPLFLLLLVASSLLYLAGMVLNDYFDREQDARERPHRPIPSGRIAETTARNLGFGLLGGGVLFGLIAAGIAGDVRPAILAVLLAGAVVLYDAILKPTLAAPVVMGSCRTLNVLLGMSVAAGPWTPAHWVAALGIGLYIVGVTTFARSEARLSGRPQLILGFAVLLAGLAVVAAFPSFATGGEWPALRVESSWYLVWVVLAAFIGYRCVRAVLDPQPSKVQPAVRNCIFALVVIDAAAVLAAQEFIWAIAILLLLVPMLILGRWIYST